ncbi:MAG: hypothetical protein LBJ75_03830 [Puniceicoccales bacterium]|nr:hypothetical protein [Puniceicoccales bacterium]
MVVVIKYNDMRGISRQAAIIGAGVQSAVAGITNMWRGETIAAPIVNIALKTHSITNGTSAALSSFEAVAKSMSARAVASTALVPFKAAAGGVNAGAMATVAQGVSGASTALVLSETATAGVGGGAMATAAQGMGASTALVHFGAVTGGANAGAIMPAPQVFSLQPMVFKATVESVNTGAMANAVWTMKGVPIRQVSFGTPTVLSEVIIEGASPAAVSKTIATETIAAKTSVGSAAGSLLGKVVALGKSAWALAVAHPVIATMAVVATIAIPALIIAWRRNKGENVIISQSNETSSDESDDIPSGPIIIPL